MTIILTDETALAFWRRSRLTGSSLLRTASSRIAYAPTVAPRSDDVTCVCSDLLASSDVAHVLVGRKTASRRSGSTAYHCFLRPFPNGSVRKVSNGLYVTTPEFTFMRLARRLDAVALVRLGLELTGSFVPNEHDLRGFSASDPVTNSHRLRRFLDRAQSLHGAVNARQAGRYLLDGAASPMEADLALLLTLPKQLGGYALPHPVLNHSLDLNAAGFPQLRRKAIIVDFAWPNERVVLEYDSDQFHTGAEKIAADSARRNDIELLGFDVQTVTNKEISSASSMDKIARTLARKLGVRSRRDPDGFANKQSQLRRTLLELRRNGPQGPKT